MGHSDFDRALLDAWHRAHQRCKDNPKELAKILRRRGMSTYTRPLRSWSLVLRACDSRIDDNSATGLVRIDRAAICRLCSPVKIDEPVSLDEAARLFGVNRTTVSRWADPADSGLSWYQDVQWQIEQSRDMKWPPSTYRVTGKRLMLDYFLNCADRKRSQARVWTPGYFGLDPGGEVWSGDWGETRSGLAERVSEGFTQQLQRVDRRLGLAERASSRGSSREFDKPDAGAEAPSAKVPAARVFQWVCPAVDGGCGRLVYKLYLPMPYWTLERVFGEGVGHKRGDASDLDPDSEAPYARFLCLKCAGLVYESAELGSSPGRRKGGSRRRVNVLDRLVKRQSGQVLRGGEVFADS